MKPAHPFYAVEIEATAWKSIMRLSESLQERVWSAIESLEMAPRASGVEKLQGFQNLYRVRVGNYRIVYEIQDDVLIVIVVKVGHRRDVYR